MDSHLAWFILLNPLVAAAIIHLFLRGSKGLCIALSTFSSIFGFIAAWAVFSTTSGAHGPISFEVPWLDFGTAFRLPIGVLIDDLSRIMLLVVTGIGALVHIYSTVYMEHDDGRGRFFGNLSLFMFSMLGIVLANNFGMMFIFWELVGVSSYLLIGHWFTKDSAAEAAKKAFLTNRIGDFGFIIGILMLWAATGTVVFGEMQEIIGKAPLATGLATVGTLLVFCGTVGKSAQFPLHVWLPDAMEGPTPVSALIHAATMVAAGVYLLARTSFLIFAAPAAGTVIAIIGCVTAVLAALFATQQDDIKRILAYSTLSQLGYMVMAAGLASPGAAMFHLYTHAFFKALLFLGSGAIIHALHHEQDIWKMGGLSKSMRVTFLTFAIGYLALIGCPLLSGFFSKDAILLAAWQHNKVIFLFALLTAFLTAFYMTRLFVVAFLGSARTEAAAHGHDGPVKMTGPLVILAIMSVVAGYGFIADKALGHQLTHLLHESHNAGGAGLVMSLATGAFIVGAGAAFALYKGRDKDPVCIPMLRDKLYFDELYDALIAGTQGVLASISAWFDTWIIGGVVKLTSGLGFGFGFTLRLLQVGNVQGYALLFGAGVIALLYIMLS